MAGRRRIPTFASGLPQTRAAVEYVERAHSGQLRTDGAAFVLDPLEVASLLYSAGAPDHVIAAGARHLCRTASLRFRAYGKREYLTLG